MQTPIIAPAAFALPVPAQSPQREGNYFCPDGYTADAPADAPPEPQAGSVSVKEAAK